MTFATGGFHGLSYVAESTYGTTPGTPSMKRVRHTGCTLELSKDTQQSAELRDDRQISDLRHGARRVQGDINFELSSGAFDDLLEAALFGTWATDVLKAGVTYKSFSMERLFRDIGQYAVYKGVMIDGFTLNMQTSGMVTGTFNCIGKDVVYSSTSLGTPTTPGAFPPFDAFGGSLKEGGSVIAVVSAVSLELKNDLAPFFALGDDSCIEVTAGQSLVTGRVSAAFQNTTLLNKFLNETESSLEVEITDPLGHGLTILLPRIKYTGGEVPVNNAGPVTLSMPFTALLDSVTGTNIQITRDLT